MEETLRSLANLSAQQRSAMICNLFRTASPDVEQLVEKVVSYGFDVNALARIAIESQCVEAFAFACTRHVNLDSPIETEAGPTLLYTLASMPVGGSSTLKDMLQIALDFTAQISVTLIQAMVENNVTCVQNILQNLDSEKRFMTQFGSRSLLHQVMCFTNAPSDTMLAMVMRFCNANDMTTADAAMCTPLALLMANKKYSDADRTRVVDFLVQHGMDLQEAIDQICVLQPVLLVGLLETLEQRPDHMSRISIEKTIDSIRFAAAVFDGHSDQIEYLNRASLKIGGDSLVARVAESSAELAMITFAA